MVAIEKGMVYITSGAVSGDTITGGITVVIDADTKFDENLVNEVIEFNIPVPPGAPSTTQAPESQLIDLKKIKHVVTVQGTFATDPTTTAFEKKRNLKILSGYGGTLEDSQMVGQTKKTGYVTVIRGIDANDSQERWVGNIIKVQFTETPGKVVADGATDIKTDVVHAVQVQIAVGKERSYR